MDAIKRIVLLGDKSVGKTCFLLSYITNIFPEDYQPTVCDYFNKSMTLDAKKVDLGFWDTEFGYSFDDLRPIVYPNTDCFIICFSVVDPNSLENIKSKWIPEMRGFCKFAPFILVGTKIDLREDVKIIEKLSQKELTPISYEMGKQFANEMGASDYFEISAKLNIGLNELVNKVAEVSTLDDKIINNNVISKKQCCLF